MLIGIMEQQSDELSKYLDTETGEIIVFNEDTLDLHYIGEGEGEGEEEELRKSIDKNPERYIWISPISSREGYQVMENFVETLPEGENRRLLEKTLSRRKPFRNFKDALLDMGEIREQWFKFHQEALTEIAKDWLSEYDLELIPVNKYLKQ